MSDKLHNIRHTLAHVLAQAVLDKYPDAKPTLGPPVDDGFYYDFAFPTDAPGEDDLKDIEKTMRKALSKWTTWEHQEVSADGARATFAGNEYKLEMIDELAQKDETITLYTCGGFTDLCRGGHTENPSKDIDPKAFKLVKVAGAYWRGDENNAMLTRIYGYAFETADELQAHLTMLEEAKKRDHRKLGKELDLFTFSELVGSGLPLFTPKGAFMRNKIEETIMSIQARYGFEKVNIPHITKKDLYEKSGHWDKFKDDLFHVHGKHEAEFVMKPMNCPHHAQIYASKMRSYRDLPVRYAETTTCYRDEQPGELLGLSRVRSLTQDDGHIFCTLEQVKKESQNLVKVVREFYTKLGMWNEDSFWVSLSVRDPQTPEKYLGDDKNWDKAEQFLEEVAKTEELPYKRVEGEAAFYGPKLDFQFKDAIGREWQLATVQIDFVQPERFELEYINEHGQKERPVMIHRAIAGSLERFMSVIIEHFAGAFPVWLAPEQVRVIPIAQAHHEYAHFVVEALRRANVRAEIAEADESLGKRIRSGKTDKVPYMIVVGDKECDDKKLTVELRNGEKLEHVDMNTFIERLEAETDEHHS